MLLQQEYVQYMFAAQCSSFDVITSCIEELCIYTHLHTNICNTTPIICTCTYKVFNMDAVNHDYIMHICTYIIIILNTMILIYLYFRLGNDILETFLKGRENLPALEWN